MTLTSVRLADSLQALIDSRLDTIERMLMGRVPRQDRLAIVKDVETQIFDILTEQANDEPTRDDVLAALAKLDPPEAYLPEGGEAAGEGRATLAQGTATSRSVTVQPSRASQNSRRGKLSGILSLAMLGLSVLSPIAYPLMVFSQSQLFGFLFFVGCLEVIFCGSLIAFVLAASTRFRDGWSIVGGILSTVPFVYSLAAGVALVSLLFG